MPSIPDMYFIFTVSEGGDVYVDTVSHSELVERVNPDEYGDLYYGDIEWLDHLPSNDPMYWGRAGLIVKGKFVTPKPKETVITYGID